MQEPEDGVTLEEELERALSATLSTQDAVSPDTADADEPENCEPVVSSASEETTEPTTAEATLADATARGSGAGAEAGQCRLHGHGRTV